MADNVTKETRSRIMSAIKGSNTKPEVLVRRWLHALGYRFRIHVKGLPGKPDIVMPSRRAVVNVNGCFWHMHDCEGFRMPRSNVSFWREKFSRNRERDEANREALLGMGWKVVNVWECAVKAGDCSDVIDRAIRSGERLVDVR